MLRRNGTVSEYIIRGVVPSPAVTEHIFDFLEKGVRDQLILACSIRLPEPLVTKFISYLGSIHANKLDGYSLIQFKLLEYNTVLWIRVPLEIVRILEVVVDDMTKEPPSKLTRSWMSWFFGL